MVLTGLDLIQSEQSFTQLIKGRIGYLCHAASVDHQLNHGLDILVGHFGKQVICAFGPQHGFTTDLQDNMIESPHTIHPQYQIPIFSLYGDTRQPTEEMLDLIDTLVVDLQDVGTRVYTYIWTLYLFMEACHNRDIRILILDRPNPAGGNTIEGNIAHPDHYSFVCQASIPMRHGLTIAELAVYFKSIRDWNIDLHLIKMQGWKREMLWKNTQLHWINPSPNLPTAEGALIYPGSVLFEGTVISEGRGTTRSLECFGHPAINPFLMKTALDQFLQLHNCKGMVLRPLVFAPTFDKFAGQSCGGFQIHCTDPDQFRSWKLVVLILHFLKNKAGINPFWNVEPYEYEYEGYAIDWINGSTKIREWIEDPQADLVELERIEKDNYNAYNDLVGGTRLY